MPPPSMAGPKCKKYPTDGARTHDHKIVLGVGNCALPTELDRHICKHPLSHVPAAGHKPTTPSVRPQHTTPHTLPSYLVMSITFELLPTCYDHCAATPAPKLPSRLTRVRGGPTHAIPISTNSNGRGARHTKTVHTLPCMYTGMCLHPPSILIVVFANDAKIMAQSMAGHKGQSSHPPWGSNPRPQD